MCCGIIQTLRNAVFGENLSLSLYLISGIYQKDVLTHNLCDFTAILLMDIVLTLPKFSKKFMIIQVIQTKVGLKTFISPAFRELACR